jgi:hypothetical protein
MRYASDRTLGVAPASASDYRELARRRLPRQLFDYVDGGAYEEVTMRANVSDLEEVLLRQVVMRDVSVREPAVEVLGQRLALPVALAPVGLAGMLAPRAEVQAARAAEAAGVPFVESTVSICSIEEVAKATSTPPWFQLYVMRDRGYAEDLIARASGRVARPRPHDRPRRGGGAPPGHAQRRGRTTELVGEPAPRARHRVPPRLDQERRPRRPAFDLRQPREGGSERAHARGFQGLGRRAVRPQRDLGRHRLGA